MQPFYVDRAADKISLCSEIANLQKPNKVRALYEEEGWSYAGLLCESCRCREIAISLNLSRTRGCYVSWDGVQR